MGKINAEDYHTGESKPKSRPAAEAGRADGFFPPVRPERSRVVRP